MAAPPHGECQVAGTPVLARRNIAKGSYNSQQRGRDVTTAGHECGGGHLHLRGTPPSLTSAQKAERVHNIFQQHRAKLSRGLTEQDIAKIIEEDEEADDLLRSINPEIMGMEEQQIAKRLRRYSEPSVGDLPIEKPDGYRRFMATQLNGCATPVVRASKVARSTSLINHYDVDVQSYIEHGLNMGRFKASETFDSFFDAEILLRSVTGHNQTENPETAHQQGGTGLMCTNEISEYLRGTGTDPRGLGRWSWMRFGSGSHHTRVVSVYAVKKGIKPGWGTVCQQHLRYCQLHDLECTPHELFCSDFLLQLQEWVRQGDRLLIMMDANEHVLDDPFFRSLCSEENGLDLVEISHRAWEGSEIGTYIDGTKPIDGVWASSGLEIGGFKILSFMEGVRDHRTMIFDVESRSLLGVDEHRVVRAPCRRLNTQTSSLPRYTSILNRLMSTHKMDDRLDRLIASIKDDNPTAAQRQQMETLDRQMVELQRCAERRCRKILKPNLEFSPLIQLWHERMQAYKMLIRWKKGFSKSSNIIRTALRRGIPNPREMSLEQMEFHVTLCKAMKQQHRPIAAEKRTEHLRERLVDANAKKDVERARGIKASMERERNGKM